MSLFLNLLKNSASEKSIIDAAENYVQDEMVGKKIVSPNVFNVTGHPRYDANGEISLKHVLGDMFIVIRNLQSKVNTLEEELFNVKKSEEQFDKVEENTEHIFALEENLRCLRESMLAAEEME